MNDNLHKAITKQDILQILIELGELMIVDYLTLIGGAVCILRHGDYRKTYDIDNISGVNIEIRGIQINSDAEAVTELPNNFEDRVEILDLNISNFTVYLVSDIDLILIKLHRANEKDWMDVEIILKAMSKETKQELLKIGDEYSKEVLGFKYKDNWEYLKRVELL